jgi:hypothetical protein
VIGSIRPAQPAPAQRRCAFAGGLALLLLSGLLCVTRGQSGAPNWPGTKPIRFEVIAAAGGLIDIVPRTLSNSLAASIAVPVVPEVRDAFAKRGVEIAHMNPNQLGAFLQAEAARFNGLLKHSRVSRASP